MDEHSVLYTKEGFCFVKNRKNNYSLSFEMKNNNIILAKIINFDLVKLIYDLNSDIYEKVNLEKINDNEANMVLLIKNLFEEIGLPQRFSHVHIQKLTETDKIKFISNSIKDKRPEWLPCEAEQLPLKEMNCICKIITPHQITFDFNIEFEQTMTLPQIAEKMVGLVIFKIFNRVKQFIENVRM